MLPSSAVGPEVVLLKVEAPLWALLWKTNLRTAVDAAMGFSSN